MDISTILLPLSSIAHSDTVLLIDVVEQKQFENGQITDTIIGYKCKVVCPGNKYQMLGVKLKHKPSITQSDIDKNNVSLKVQFKNFSGKLFQGKDKQVYISAQADELMIVK